MSNSSQMKVASEVSEQVSAKFRQGNSEEAFALLERAYGPQARTIMERVMNQYNLDDNQMARLFGTVANYIENAVTSTKKLEANQEKTEKIEAAIRAEEEAKRIEAYNEQYEKRQESLESFIDDIDKERKKLDKEKGGLDKEEEKERRKLAKEKEIAKRRKIEEKLKVIALKRKELETRRQELEAMRQMAVDVSKDNTQPPLTAEEIQAKVQQVKSNDSNNNDNITAMMQLKLTDRSRA